MYFYLFLNTLNDTCDLYESNKCFTFLAKNHECHPKIKSVDFQHKNFMDLFTENALHLFY